MNNLLPVPVLAEPSSPAKAYDCSCGERERAQFWRDSRYFRGGRQQTYERVAELADASGLAPESKECGFDPRRTHQPKQSMTAYFTFGQNHQHIINGKMFDKDTVVKIESSDPRATMFEVFGQKWSMQYDEVPPMEYFPKGVIEL